MESQNKEVRAAALNTLVATAEMRGARRVRASLGASLAGAPSHGSRSIFTLKHSTRLSDAVMARDENDPTSPDSSVNNAFDGLGSTRDFYEQVFQRNSIDDRGMRLDGYVHFDSNYNNAFWNGQHMVFGDGDGVIFTDFTGSLDVIGHELTHGVTEHTAGLEYHMQSGALNESVSDVFGSLVKQWRLKQTADAADWLIGADIFTPDIDADALRSMKAPGTAYNNEHMGKDLQPDNMNRFMSLPDTDAGDWGGVHINSGIPNKAFYLTASAIGGHAWEAPGLIWYESLKASSQKTQFQEFAETTFAKAGQLFSAGSAEQRAVHEAWRAVGIRISATTTRLAPRRVNWEEDGLAALTRKIDEMSASIAVLTKEVNSLKSKGNGQDGRPPGRRPPPPTGDAHL